MTDNNLTADAQTLADETIGHLLRHPDAVARYAAIDLLADRTTWLRAVTLKQLEIERGGVGPAADAVGISRQAVTQLYAKTDTPGPRAKASAGAVGGPAYVYGQWLAWAEQVAEAVGRRDEYDKVYVESARSTTTSAGVQRRVDDWLRVGRRRSKARMAELERVMPPVAEAVAELGVRRLTTDEQWRVHLGFHHAQQKAGVGQVSA